MNESDTIRLDLPASHRYLSVLGACITEVLGHLDGIADAESTVYGVQLAAHEICTNIVDHAYAELSSGRIAITLTMERQPLRVVIELQDSGRSFNPERVPTPSLDAPQEHGYGLFLARTLMDEISYQPQSGGNYWRLVKSL